MTKTQNQEAKIEAPAQSKSRLGCVIKCLIGCGIVIVLFLGANYLYQENFARTIDPSIVEPVEIVAGSGSTDDINDTPKSLTDAITNELIAEAEHPLDPLVKIARQALRKMNREVQDYSATIVKQEVINGRLGREQYMFVKIRHESKDEQNPVPFSVYGKFLRPKSLAGQEVIWVKGRNQGKLIAHPAGLFNVMRLTLDPEGPLAMRGNRYSIQKHRH